MIRLIQETRIPSTAHLAKSAGAFKMLLNRTDLGFFRLSDRGDLWQESYERAKHLAQYEHLAVLGIGGSSLGGRALIDALGIANVEFFENVDGRDFWERLESLKLKNLSKVHWVIISKSGQTIETLGQVSFISHFLKSQGFSLESSSTVITEKRSNPLYDWAIKHKIPVLEIPVDVGGRFSVLSPVGLFPAAFAGLDIDEIRNGARWALKQDELVSKLAAHTLLSFEKQEWITAFWVYCTRLYSWGLWTQQLWAESLAKKVNRAGADAPRVSTPVALIGANDQHSVLQQVAEGARDKFIWFLRVTDSETFGPVLKDSLFAHQNYLVGKPLGALLAAEAQATSNALEKSGVHSISLQCDEMSAATMGALFMTMELVVGTLGEVLEINAFDQPGVELGKRLALDILK